MSSPLSAAPSLPSATCHVHKFGGSSLADASRIRVLPELLTSGLGDTTHGRTPQPPETQVVVVSAMHGTTNALTEMAQRAEQGKDWAMLWQPVHDVHLAAARGLGLPADQSDALVDAITAELDALHALLEAAPSNTASDAAGAADADSLDADSVWFAQVQGAGELLSSRLVQAALGADWARLDARDVLVVHPGEMGVGVDWDATRAKLTAWREAQQATRLVVTGFIARDTQGRDTTLGRNGSDYSAAIFANLFNAAELTIWTDVDGVLSADPRLVPEATVLPTMSYAEACELAYFGAKVLHPQTMAPVQSRGIPLRIRNTLNPSAPGTRILATNPEGETPLSPVKGLSLVRGLAVLELVGNGMVGVPGTAEKLFAALHGAGVSVTMISQGSSEHSICCIVQADQLQRGREAVEAAFADAMADARTQAVETTNDICVLAAVGDGMVGTPGVTARLLGGLAQARVNVRAIAQGASERNVSVAIAEADATRALRAAHSAFWLSPQTVSVGVIGPGNVGRSLLAQLATVLPGLRKRSQVDLRLRAIANSRHMALAPVSMDPNGAVAGLQTDDALPADLDAFAAHVRADHIPHAMIVDCSASDATAAHYARWLAAGIHVVTPNKHAGSGDWSRYTAIGNAQRSGGGRFRYEATVGAGLPVVLTLRNLIDTGDSLQAVDGMLSGTLAWLFNSYDGSRPFSALVREARELGYTEPDPRDDLSGLDVARKLVILAREAGLQRSLEDVAVESLIPEALQRVSLDEFMARLDELDAPMQARLDAAQSQGMKLRHLAQLTRDGKASVGVVALPADHACCHTRLTDNLVQFTTDRYADNPLVVQGPGAGPDVTAAGVFGDVLAIAHALSAAEGRYA